MLTSTWEKWFHELCTLIFIIFQLTQGIIGEVKRLPGNNRCVDCNAEGND